QERGFLIPDMRVTCSTHIWQQFLRELFTRHPSVYVRAHSRLNTIHLDEGMYVAGFPGSIHLSSMLRRCGSDGDLLPSQT
ncbi:hypothetical protein EMPG_16643, partial [Blastomyces silverae]